MTETTGETSDKPDWWLEQLQQHRAIAVIRSPGQSLGVAMAKAVAQGGIRLIEITWNSAQPEALIEQLRTELPQCTIGCGTILTRHQLHQAINSGAQFLFSPHVNPTLIRAAVAARVPIVPGALSPTEIVTAWQSGASCVKVFPIQAVGGASYIKSLQGPLGQIPLIPTGGVTLKNAPQLIEAGAIAVGLSGELFPKKLVLEKNWQAIAERSQTLQQQVSKIGQSL